jgi:hypothetical protein
LHSLGRRRLGGRFDGEAISSGNGLLLAKVEVHTGIVAGLADPFVDNRDTN